MHNPPTVHLAASGGGHIEVLLGLRDVFAGYRRAWVTTQGPRADSLCADGERVLLVPPMDQRRPDPRNPLRSLRLVARERPNLVVTSGAGVVAAFAIAARGLGARLLFVETMARVSSPSATARILAPIASDVFVQWPAVAAHVRRARICRPALLGDIASRAANRGEGTFAAVGSHNKPFDRLLRELARAAGEGILPGPVRVQSGASTYTSSVLATKPWMDPAEVAAHLRGARYVVCHGGAGIIAGALKAGRRPLVMSRRRELREHVDDHQSDLVGELDGLGLAVRTRDPITPADGGAADHAWPRERPWERWPDLRDAVAAALSVQDPAHLSREDT